MKTIDKQITNNVRTHARKKLDLEIANIDIDPSHFNILFITGYKYTVDQFSSSEYVCIFFPLLLFFNPFTFYC